jgi:hypothetical protein
MQAVDGAPSDPFGQLGVDPLADLHRCGHRPPATRGQVEQLGPGVGRRGPAPHQPQLDHLADHLGRGLLGDAEPGRQVGQRERLVAQGPEDHAEGRADLGEPAPVELVVQQIDESAQREGQQDAEVGAVAVVGHLGCLLKVSHG